MPDHAAPTSTEEGAVHPDTATPGVWGPPTEAVSSTTLPGDVERRGAPPGPPVGPGSGSAPVTAAPAPPAPPAPAAGRGPAPPAARGPRPPAGDSTNGGAGDLAGFPTVGQPPTQDRPPRRRATSLPPRPPMTSLPDAGRHGRRQVEVVRGRRSRRIVRRVDTWTVLKVSAIFYLCALLVVVVATVLLWYLASAFGTIHAIEKSVRTLFDYTTYTLHPGAVFLYTALGGLLFAVFGTLLNVLAAMLYNLISDVVGGLQIIVLSEDEQFPQP